VTVYESVSAAWKGGRTEKARRGGSTALLVTVVAFLSRRLPTLRKFRSAILQTTALGFLDYAAYSWHHIVGYAAIGVSLFLLEYLTSDSGRGA
jgi:hypothetical protein